MRRGAICRITGGDFWRSGVSLQVEWGLMKPGLRKIGRRIFNGVTLLSLLLGIVVAGLWMCRPSSEGQQEKLLHIGSLFATSSWNGCGIAYEPSLSSLSFYDQLPYSVLHGTPLNGYYNLGVRGHIAVAPYWLLIALLSVLPISWIILYRRRRWRTGMCCKCGYDLRASKDRCPECGEPIPPPIASIEK